jgi:hypothetical protein
MTIKITDLSAKLLDELERHSKKVVNDVGKTIVQEIKQNIPVAAGPVKHSGKIYMPGSTRESIKHIVFGDKLSITLKIGADIKDLRLTGFIVRFFEFGTTQRFTHKGAFRGQIREHAVVRPAAARLPEMVQAGLERELEKISL